MVLLRGRVAYFGPSGAPALDFIGGLPGADAAARPAGLSDAVRAPAGVWGC
jgi:hypothetical protein